jgi:hypothetical protein
MLEIVRCHRHHRAEGGFSIPELSVSVLLLSILLLLTIGAFIPGLKVTRQAEESVASQREVVLAFERLMAEMSLMDRVGVTAGPGCLAFLSHEVFRGTNPLLELDELQVLGFATATTVWTKWVVLRLRDGRLWRREFPYDGGNSLARVRPDKLVVVADQPDRQEKVFCREVEEFSAHTLGQSRVLLKLRSVHRGANKPQSCDMSFEIVMRGTNG